MQLARLRASVSKYWVLSKNIVVRAKAKIAGHKHGLRPKVMWLEEIDFVPGGSCPLLSLNH